MNHIRVSLDDLAPLYRHVYIGKLFRGFIHNLNGPLHAFGIEMDMIGHLLLNRGDNGSEVMDRLQSRLQRLEEEFDRMTGLIRVTTEGIDLNEPGSGFFHLNAFIQQQMAFLKADLYFKHHVEVDLRLATDLVVLRDPETNPALGLVWLMQAVIEEMERAKLQKLQLETSMVGSGSPFASISKREPYRRNSEGLCSPLWKGPRSPSSDPMSWVLIFPSVTFFHRGP